MITEKDIKTKRFEQAKPGYKPEEVDDFLNLLGDQITALLKEKEETEKKIEVLVDSIRRYKADEDALKDAMISAQKQGRILAAEAQEKADEIIQEAQANAEKIIAAANVKAKEILGAAVSQSQNEAAELQKVRDEVKNFKTSLLEMYREHLTLITAIPADEDEEEYEQEAEAVDEEELQAARDVAAAMDEMGVTRVMDTVTD